MPRQEQDKRHPFLALPSRLSWPERKRLLRTQTRLAVVAAYALIALAYLWPAAYRKEAAWFVVVFWFAFMLRTFLFHLAPVAIALTGACAWLRQWRLAVASALLVILAAGPTARHYRPKSPPALQGETVTVMSINLLAANNQAAPIIRQIRQNDPEILIFQEYTSFWHAALQDALGADYPYCCSLTREDSFGSAIYSRRPFGTVPQQGLVLSGGWQPILRAVVQIGGRDVAVYDIHLLPPRRYDYTVTWRRHFADVLGLLQEETLPVILAGDFNFTDNSIFADDLRRAGFSSAYSIAGWGRGSTWPALDGLWWFPRVRLDHVFLRGGLTCSHAQTGKPFGSDHLPLTVAIGFGTS